MAGERRTNYSHPPIGELTALPKCRTRHSNWRKLRELKLPQEISMTDSRHYDTVAFDVRDNATMLFFARTTAAGDIEDYLLLMRAEGDDIEEAIYIEINENQFAGHDLIQEARMTGNMLTLQLREPVSELGGASEIVLTYDDSPENRTSIESGAFRVLGNTLAGGHA
jgi:hypothetical protein